MAKPWCTSKLVQHSLPKPPYADWTAINVGGLDEKAKAEG